jgi:hypothetical protein
MVIVATKGNTIVLSEVTSDDAAVLEWCGLVMIDTKEIYDDEYDYTPIEVYESWKKEDK